MATRQISAACVACNPSGLHHGAYGNCDAPTKFATSQLPTSAPPYASKEIRVVLRSLRGGRRPGGLQPWWALGVPGWWFGFGGVCAALRGCAGIFSAFERARAVVRITSFWGGRKTRMRYPRPSVYLFTARRGSDFRRINKTGRQTLAYGDVMYAILVAKRCAIFSEHRGSRAAGSRAGSVRALQSGVSGSAWRIWCVAHLVGGAFSARGACGGPSACTVASYCAPVMGCFRLRIPSAVPAQRGRPYPMADIPHPYAFVRTKIYYTTSIKRPIAVVWGKRVKDTRVIRGRKKIRHNH